MPTGSCLCGKVAYEYTGESAIVLKLTKGEPALAALCHCHSCQKWCGATASSNLIVPRDGFRVTKGEPKAYKQVADSGKMNTRNFCGDCGSSLYGELELMPDIIGIKAG